MRRVISVLKGLNTHLAFWVGTIGTSLCCFLFVGGKAEMESWSVHHLDGLAGTVNAGIEGIALVALYAWFPALIGAAIGRPPWIPQRGVLTAKDDD